MPISHPVPRMADPVGFTSCMCGDQVISHHQSRYHRIHSEHEKCQERDGTKRNGAVQVGIGWSKSGKLRQVGTGKDKLNQEERSQGKVAYFA